MSDPLFPSGPWTGFYHYQPQDRHRMDLHLNFSGGQLRGEGNDDIGPFMIRGEYDATSLACGWIKTYPGSHAVYYHGYREGKGIWGRWDIGRHGHGGFHIWPKGVSEGEQEVASIEQANPVEAIGLRSDVKQPAPAPASQMQTYRGSATMGR